MIVAPIESTDASMVQALINEILSAKAQLVELDERYSQQQAITARLKAEGEDVNAAETQLRQDERQRADLCERLLILETGLDTLP